MLGATDKEQMYVDMIMEGIEVIMLMNSSAENRLDQPRLTPLYSPLYISAVHQAEVRGAHLRDQNGEPRSSYGDFCTCIHTPNH
jgi:hypothetical protein